MCMYVCELVTPSGGNCGHPSHSLHVSLGFTDRKSIKQLLQGPMEIGLNPSTTSDLCDSSQPLSLSFPTCKMGVVKIPAPQRSWEDCRLSDV